MRRKREPVLNFESSDEGHLKIVVEYRRKYNRISGLLDKYPEILSLVNQDLQRLSQGRGRGRQAKYTSENVLRALIVHVVEGESWRGTIVKIAESAFLQDFLRLGNRRVMDFTFLNKCFKAIRPETWDAINGLLAVKAAAEQRIDPSQVRADTTVVESNVHYPTDSSLLWDSWRVLSRLLRAARGLAPHGVPHRFHDRKVKKLHLFVTRYITSRSNRRRRKVNAAFRKLIGKVGDVVRIAEGFCASVEAGVWNVDLEAVAAAIGEFLPVIRTVLATSERAQVEGETVPARDRVFSIFEPHVELIQRGKRSKPVEFGHGVLLSQTPEKFITDYVVMPERVADSKLTAEVIARHEARFGAAPQVVVADQGFNPKPAERAPLEAKVETLAIPRRLADWGNEILVKLQGFRAGIEGTISVLKRAFGLFRCRCKGFSSFAASVGMAVFCHNLIVLSRASP